MIFILSTVVISSTCMYLKFYFILFFLYIIIMNVGCYVIWFGFYNYHFLYNGHLHHQKNTTLWQNPVRATVMRSIKYLPEIMCNLRDPNLYRLLSTLMFISRRDTLHLLHFWFRFSYILDMSTQPKYWCPHDQTFLTINSLKFCYS